MVAVAYMLDLDMFLNFNMCFAGSEVANNRSNITESTPKARVSGELTDQGNNSHPLRGEAFNVPFMLLVLEYNLCNILSHFSLALLMAFCLMQFYRTLLKCTPSSAVSLTQMLPIMCRNLKRWIL